MAVDMFLKLEDIEGEAQDEGGHAGAIDIVSWAFGASQSATTHQGTGGGSGAVNVRDMTITKHVDKSSPLLFAYCCNGTHIGSAQLTVRKAGGSAPLGYLKIIVEDIIVSGYDTGGEASTNEMLVETI